jgi:cell division septation protein DedD
MSEDGFHEIQLNGKQLVFMFMAATVAAVVIFLCGVLVGRGVPVTHAEAAADPLEQQAVDPTEGAQTTPPVAADPTDASAAAEDLTYSRLLESPKPATETIAPLPDAAAGKPFDTPGSRDPQVVRKPAPAPSSVPPPARNEPREPVDLPRIASPDTTRRDTASPTAPTAAEPVLAEPPGNGFVVQVAAVRARAEAMVIAQRLGSKGYPAFVTTAGANIFRVRVGKYTDRGAAEAVAGRLEREEQFKPWITR